METRILTRMVCALSLAWLCGCAPSGMIEKFADDAKQQLARDYLRRLIDGDTAALAGEIEPELRSANVAAQFDAMRAVIPREAPTVTNLVGYRWHRSGDLTRYNLTYQFGYGSKWVVANVAWSERPNGVRQIAGMSAYPLRESLQETHALSLKRAGPKHYLFLSAVIIVPLFCVVTLVACLRTRPFPRKWLWVIFILVGFVSFSLNWTTGEVGVAPLSFRLLGAGAMTASIYSPWSVSFSIPLGAILFWFKRRRLMKRVEPPVVLIGSPP